MNKTEIGNRIKSARLSLGLTQKQLTDGYMTRNMLSLIESGNALPSLETAEYLADKLDISLSYLLLGIENKPTDDAESQINELRNLYAKGAYRDCLTELNKIKESNYEIDYIYAYSAFHYAKTLTENGSFTEAQSYLKIALEKSKSTAYDTSYIEAAAPIYLAIASNVQSPLLELDINDYERKRFDAFDYEVYKYLTSDYDFPFPNTIFKMHVEAKQLMKKYRFSEAIKLLCEIEETKSEGYNAFVFFGVYTDLESSYKQLGDFEKAYRYSSKRFNLLNAFNS